MPPKFAAKQTKAQREAETEKRRLAAERSIAARAKEDAREKKMRFVRRINALGLAVQRYDAQNYEMGELPRTLLLEADPLAADIAALRLGEMGLFKIQYAMTCEFINVDGFHTHLDFSSRLHTVLDVSEIEQALVDAGDEIATRIDENVVEGSGLAYDGTVDFQFFIYHIGMTSGCRHIKTPNVISNTKGVLNIKNDDDMCFAYSVIAHFERPDKNAIRAKFYKDLYPKYAHLFKGLKFPVDFNQIKNIFEKNNPEIAVYVYAPVGENKVKGAAMVTQRYMSQNAKTANRIIDLLYLMEKKKGADEFCDAFKVSRLSQTPNTHYTLITDIQRLLRSLNNHHRKKWLCCNCFQCQVSQNAHDLHVSNCLEHAAQNIKYPDAGSKKKFENYQNQQCTPFDIHVDFETFAKLLNAVEDEKISTKRLTEHKPASFGLYPVCIDGTFHEPILHQQGPEFNSAAALLNEFYRCLDEQSDLINAQINTSKFKDTKNMIITEEQQEVFDKLKINGGECYICKQNIKANEIDPELIPV